MLDLSEPDELWEQEMEAEAEMERLIKEDEEK